jgi:tellurite resistance protein
LRDARANQSSELVREFAETRGTGFGFTDSPDEIESETTAALGGAMRVLDEKAPEEKEAYRQFVLEVAQSVADAAGGGEAAESATIEKIRAAVG